ncbi:MAG: preprotein translocase subunit SecE [Dermatophilaceae bacterium]
MTDVGAPTRASNRRGGKGLSPVARLRLFVKQVLDELRKVVRPTRAELVNYTVVVIVFVSAVMAFTAGLDFGFTKLVLWVFGG